LGVLSCRFSTAHIVNIAQVSGAFELSFNKLVEWVQVTVCPELTGEIADGQPPGPEGGGQVVTGEPGHLVFFGQHSDAALQDAVNQPHHIPVADEAAQDGAHNGVVDAGEELAQVAL
jgi:hypothetical protein